MTTEPKIHEIDGVLYVEDGHPNAGEAIVTPFLFDGTPFYVRHGEQNQVRPEHANQYDLTRFIRLRRLEP